MRSCRTKNEIQLQRYPKRPQHLNMGSTNARQRRDVRRALPAGCDGTVFAAAVRHYWKRKPHMSIRVTHPNRSGLNRNRANYVPLTPSFLLRGSSVYPDQLAVACGERRYNWRETLERAKWLGNKDCEGFLTIGDPSFTKMTPKDEWDAIALNYTSGTTCKSEGGCLRDGLREGVTHYAVPLSLFAPGTTNGTSHLPPNGLGSRRPMVPPIPC
jgi:hypothetical protein